MAAVADWVIATERASFALTEVLFGLIPQIILPVIAERIGAGPARRLALSAKDLNATAAARLGLVDVCAAPGKLKATVKVQMKRWLRASPAAPPRTTGRIDRHRSRHRSRVSAGARAAH